MSSGEQVVGVLELHVDDAVGGGTEEFYGVMAKIRETLAVGSHETSNFRYKGLRVSTMLKEEQPVFEINVDGDDYLASCRTMNVPLVEDTDLSPPQSMTDYRSVVGAIGYASSEFRPDLAWETSSLSRQFVTPTILDAKRANAALQYSQKNRVILKYRRGVENLSMFHDGSLGNLDDGKSQGGRIAYLTNKTGHSVALRSFGNLEQSSGCVVRLRHPKFCRLWKVTTRPCGSWPCGRKCLDKISTHCW
jgi:hypothetical protein